MQTSLSSQSYSGGLPDAAAVPNLPSGGQDLPKFLEPGPQVAEALDEVHGGQAFHLAAAFQFVHEVDHGHFTQGTQRLLVTGRVVDEPGYQGGEGTELVAARSDPGRLHPVRLACGQLAEVVASVPVAIRSREPHGGDRAEPDGTRAL